MNASRSRREVTSETSISDTYAKGPLGRASPFPRHFQQRFGHVFLADNQIDEQQIKRDEFKPEIVNRLADEQEGKQYQHPGICHQEAPPPERRAGQISIARRQPVRNFAAELLAGYIAQLFQVRREHFLLASKVQIQCEEELVPRFGASTELLIIGSQGRGRI